MVFPFRGIIQDYQVKPLDYISFLIGYEGKGSLKSYLSKKRWANSLEAGIFHQTSELTLYLIKFELTELGYNHMVDIQKAVFAYIELIEEKGIN